MGVSWQMLAEKLDPYPHLRSVVAETIKAWPEHQRYCETRFKADADDFLTRADEFARLALVNVGDELPRYIEDYRWMCERFLEEEIHFQREGSYRLSTFADAYR